MAAASEMQTSLRTPQRIVTGHNAAGQAVVALDGPAPLVVHLEAIPGTVFHELWSTGPTPVPVDNGADPVAEPLGLPPPPGGTRIRIVDIPPDTADFLAHGAERMQAAFKRIGDAAASTVQAHSPHPLMHRTETVDYGIVIEGEITLVLDAGERDLKAGDVVIQRGTNHAWANRSGRMCRMAFVLLSGRFAEGVPGGTPHP
jgi:mannose-6-phosphate isomerase-like protein (cupin superfamily)